MINLLISDIGILIDSDIDMHILESYTPFLADNEGEYRYDISRVDRLEELKEKPEYCGVSFNEYGDGRRRFFDSEYREYADAFYDLENHSIDLRYLSVGEKFLNETGNAFFHIAWEKLLLKEDRIILHGACIRTGEGDGILLIGPSGIGKSTQARLWEEYEKAELINGDRTVIDINTMKAYGSPYAGSSRCYVNENVELKAAVCLRKGKDNSIRKLSGRNAVVELFSNMTVNSWDRQFVDKALRMAAAIAEKIDVYEMYCTPDERAVLKLKGELNA